MIVTLMRQYHHAAAADVKMFRTFGVPFVGMTRGRRPKLISSIGPTNPCSTFPARKWRAVDDGTDLSAAQDMLVGMAICQDCNQEMLTASSCTVSALNVRGVAFDLVPYGRDGTAGPGRSRCGDCGVEPAGLHHLGCDMARCPRCRGQLFGCGCPFDEFAGADGDVDDEDDGYDESPADDVRPTLVGLAMVNPCPACGSESVIPILYGLPTAALKPLSEARQVEIAGCCWDEAKPSSRCRDCGHAWARGTG